MEENLILEGKMTESQDTPPRQAEKPGNGIPGNRRDNARVTYRSGVTSINKTPPLGAKRRGGTVLGRGRFGPKTGQVFEGFVGKSFLGGGTWAKGELQPTSNGYELIQVDDCDADEVPQVVG